MTQRRILAALALTAAFAAPATAPAAAHTPCPHHGALDDAFCDANRDLVADAPEPARQRDPSTLVFAYTPVEDPALYASQFRPFLEHLTACTGRRTVYFQVTSNAAQVEAMRSGRLQSLASPPGPRPSR
jgi:phosphonate transport system substrate-binding protein